ncbi:hypothetical protein CSUI_001925 [Cystoisospora suis]|uniref:Uncharacterized protein n=1 Tax=Cystoisospora suis TaxID=483139 RepID=A0A2C6LB31_9APIC|nr:hypothetical protein CSUI_001925 [Cystoisospora suis]
MCITTSSSRHLRHTFPGGQTTLFSSSSVLKKSLMHAIDRSLVLIFPSKKCDKTTTRRRKKSTGSSQEKPNETATPMCLV